MSTMTPMKKVSNNINNLRKNIDGYFEELSLNKVDPKYTRHGTTKGVENDFIHIFKSEKHKISFAISYDYINKKEEDYRVQVSVKLGPTNDDIVSSTPMTLEEFKTKINSFNKLFRDIKIENKPVRVDAKYIVDQVSKSFLNQTYDLESEVKAACEEVKKFKSLAESALNIPKLNSQQQSAIKSLQLAEKTIKDTLDNSPEGIRIAQLEAELQKLRAVHTSNKKKLEQQHNISGLKKDVENANQKVYYANNKLNEQLEEKMQTYPGRVYSRIRV